MISTTPAAQQPLQRLLCAGGFARKKEGKKDLQERMSVGVAAAAAADDDEEEEEEEEKECSSNLQQLCCNE